MKTTLISESKAFKPVIIQLQFDSQEELDAFGKLANCGIINDAIRAVGGKPIDYQVFADAGANIDNTKVLVEHILQSHWAQHHYHISLKSQN